MNGTSFPSNRKSARAAGSRLSPRWSSVLMALAVMLSIGSVGRTVQAQDGGTVRVSINTSMLTSIRPQEICVGEYASIRLQVIREHTPVNPQAGFVKPLREQRMVPVTAKVADTSIASLGSEGGARQVIRADSDRPGEVEWLVKGEKEGETEVVITTDEIARLPDETFDDKAGGFFGSNTITRSVPVKVKNCEYKVDLMSSWTVPGEAHLTVKAWFDGAPLERTDAEGQEYAGQTEVNWVITLSGVGDCNMNSLELEGGKANLKGHKENDDTRLVVEIEFEPLQVTGSGICISKITGESIEMNMDVQLVAGPLRLAVPANSAGSSGQTHDLKDPGGITVGNTFIVVYPSNALQ